MNPRLFSILGLPDKLYRWFEICDLQDDLSESWDNQYDFKSKLSSVILKVFRTTNKSNRFQELLC